MIYSWKVGTYARSIYLWGSQRFTARNGYTGIPAEYHEPVKQYAAQYFYKYEIDNALVQGWLTQEEYDQTIVYGYRPDPPLIPTKQPAEA
jgi:hypothetical protein